MTSKTEPILCVVCSAPLPHITREEALQKGAATVIGDQTYYHCAGGRHTPEQIQMSIAAVPRFSTAGKKEYGCSEGGIWTPCRKCECLSGCERGKKETAIAGSLK